MEFAKKQLEKYGWSEGKGLGKNEDGISIALKPKLKFDKSGVGHDYGKEFSNQWWNDLYNKSANQINVEPNTKADEETNIEVSKTKTERKKKKSKKSEYNNFVKTAKLTVDGLVSYGVADAPQRDEGQDLVIKQLTDEELFLACQGRTAHKGARHGLKLSGKLARIEKQEKLLAKKLQKISFDAECNIAINAEKKIKKLEKFKPQLPTSTSTTECSRKKKCKKKKRKSVSFNETVTEYHTQELDTSSQSNDSVEPPIILKSKIKNSNESDDNTGQLFPVDEGIDIDDMKPPPIEAAEEIPMQEEEQAHKKKKKSKKSKHQQDDEKNMDILLKVCKRKKCKEDEAKLALEGTRKKRKQIIEEQMFSNMSACLNQVCRISESE